MGKLLWGMCIALLFTSLAGGWHLGQLQSQLIEIRMQLVVDHWANIAVIGDRIYLIEPQDDRVILEKKINRKS